MTGGWTGGRHWPQVLLAALAVALVVALVAVGATAADPLNPYNPDWDGTSTVHDRIGDDPDTERVVATDTGPYTEGATDGTVAVVIAPDDPYEGADRDRVASFVADGGTLVVLEDFGEPGARLLEDVGATASPDGRVLVDEYSYARGPLMPVATGVEDHPRTAGVEQVTLNLGTAVDPGEATVLVRTSGFAYLAADPADPEGGEEPVALDRHPVATVEPVGDGQVILVGDASLAINAMQDEPDNAAFVDGLLAEHERVIIDLSHGPDPPPVQAALLWLRASPATGAALAALALGLALVAGRFGIAGWIDRRLRPRGERDASARAGTVMSDTECLAYLRRRHPDWDERRLERIIASLNRHRSEPRVDE